MILSKYFLKSALVLSGSLLVLSALAYLSLQVSRNFLTTLSC